MFFVMLACASRFSARTSLDAPILALCTLPRTDPGKRTQYIHAMATGPRHT